MNFQIFASQKSALYWCGVLPHCICAKINFQIFASQKSALVWCAIHGTRIPAKKNLRSFASQNSCAMWRNIVLRGIHKQIFTIHGKNYAWNEAVASFGIVVRRPAARHP